MQRQFVSGPAWAGGLIAIACLSSLGCGESKPPVPDLVPVTGKIMFQGKPLARGSLVFVPLEEETKKAMPRAVERPAAEIDSEGGYELLWAGESVGAPPGKYKVIIVAFKEQADTDDSEAKPQSLIPEKYANPKTSGLTATVTEDGENVFNFDLQS